MIIILFLILILLLTILFISKKGSIREKVLGLAYYYLIINLLVFYFSEKAEQFDILKFMNIVNIVFLLFVMFIIKYLTMGEK